MTRRRSGMTLVEVLIASVILLVLVVIVFSILMNTSSHYQNQAVMLSQDDRAREVLNQIADELRMSKWALVVPPLPAPGTGSPVQVSPTAIYSDLQFRVPGKIATSTTQLAEYRQNPDRLFTKRIRYRWMPDPADANDGVDNNNNGTIDEGVIEKTEEDLSGSGAVLATRRSRICYGVKDYVFDTALGRMTGLLFKVPAQDRIEITLDLEKVDPNDRTRKITRTVQTTIELRN